VPTIFGPLTLIDLALIVGIAVVLPLALGGRAFLWLLTAASAAAALWQPAGSRVAVVLALPVAMLAIASAISALRRIRVPATLPDEGRLVAQAYAMVAASWLVISCGGWRPLGIREPIVELTAVHFTYAGVGALMLAATAARRPAPSLRWLAPLAVILTAAAPPVVAMGFTMHAAAAQVGGAVLMTLGVWCTAIALLHQAARSDVHRPQRGLLVVAGLAVWVPMLLAIAWAAAQYWSVPALSVSDMARTHGVVNGVGFVIAGLVATAADRRTPRWR
jgi:hypothetical protein